MAEAHGMIFDIAVIGILIFWLNKNGETRQRIRTYKDEIDDFQFVGIGRSGVPYGG